MTHADRLRTARDRLRAALLDALEPSGSLGPGADDLAALHAVPEALAATGDGAAARRVLDRALRDLDGPRRTEHLAALACAALRLGRGEVLSRVRAVPGVDGDDPVPALILGARVALGAGDGEGVDAALSLLANRDLDPGHAADVLALAADARALVADHDALADRALAALRERAPAGPSELARRVRALAALHRVRGAADLLDLVDRDARALLAALPPDGRLGPPRGWTTPTATALLATHEALASLDAPEPRPRRETSGWRVVLCNTPPEHASRIAEALVAERLAACVNVVPAVQSHYVWKGEAQRDNESTLLIKTAGARVAALTARIRALHPYELPEIVALTLNPDEGLADYLAWVSEQVAP